MTYCKKNKLPILISSFSLAAFLVFMLLDLYFRVVAYTFFLMFVMSSVFLLHRYSMGMKVDKFPFYVFFIFFAIIAKDFAVFTLGGGVRGDFLFYDLGSLLFFSSLYMLYVQGGGIVFYSRLMLFFYCLGAAFSLTTYLFPKSVLDVLNFGPAFMLPGAFAFSQTKLGWSNKRYITILLLLLALLASALVEARGVTLALIIGMTLLVVRRVGLYRFSSLIIIVYFCFMLIGTLVVASNYPKDLVLNKILTNRPLIWGSYYEFVVSESPYLGIGPVAEGASENAADVVKQESQRGGTGSYGAHSVFVHSLTTNGFIGLFFSSLVLLYVMRPNRHPIWPGLMAGVAMCLFGGVYLGAPNWYGLVLSSAVIIDVLSRKRPTVAFD